MDLKVKLGCSVCHHFQEQNVNMPFSCEGIICPKCGEINSMSIIAIIQDSGIYQNDLLRNLYKIRQL